MHHATAHGNIEQMEQLLLSNPGLLNLENKEHRTPLR